MLGIVVMDNQLKPTTKKVIQELNQSKFKSIIATGDNIFTAISVAKKADIIRNSNQVIYSQQVIMDHNCEQHIKWDIEDCKYLNASYNPSLLLHQQDSNRNFSEQST